MRHAISCAVIFYNAGVVTCDRRVGSWNTNTSPQSVFFLGGGNGFKPLFSFQWRITVNAYWVKIHNSIATILLHPNTVAEYNSGSSDLQANAMTNMSRLLGALVHKLELFVPLTLKYVSFCVLWLSFPLQQIFLGSFTKASSFPTTTSNWLDQVHCFRTDSFCLHIF
jgi:hypothetical protein